jgi:hypothetical protein
LYLRHQCSIEASNELFRLKTNKENCGDNLPVADFISFFELITSAILSLQQPIDF